MSVVLRSEDGLSRGSRGGLLNRGGCGGCRDGDRDSYTLGLGDIDSLVGDIVDSVDLKVALEDGAGKGAGSQGGSSDQGRSAHNDSL